MIDYKFAVLQPYGKHEHYKKKQVIQIDFEPIDNQPFKNKKPGWIAQELPSPWGPAAAAWVEGRSCVFFAITSDTESLRLRLQRLFPFVDFEAPAPQDMCDSLVKEAPNAQVSRNFLLRGTAFQIAVWKALLDIPMGTTVSYQKLAQSLGYPKAARAVGQAVGANPVAWWVPCHRVVAASGKLGGYAWGLEVKKKMLQFEQSKLTMALHG